MYSKGILLRNARPEWLRENYDSENLGELIEEEIINEFGIAPENAFTAFYYRVKEGLINPKGRVRKYAENYVRLRTIQQRLTAKGAKAALELGITGKKSAGKYLESAVYNWLGEKKYSTATLETIEGWKRDIFTPEKTRELLEKISNTKGVPEHLKKLKELELDGKFKYKNFKR